MFKKTFIVIAATLALGAAAQAESFNVQFGCTNFTAVQCQGADVATTLYSGAAVPGMPGGTWNLADGYQQSTPMALKNTAGTLSSTVKVTWDSEGFYEPATT